MSKDLEERAVDSLFLALLPGGCSYALYQDRKSGKLTKEETMFFAPAAVIMDLGKTFMTCCVGAVAYILLNPNNYK